LTLDQLCFNLNARVCCVGWASLAVETDWQKSRVRDTDLRQGLAAEPA